MSSFLPVLKQFTLTPGVQFDYNFTYYQGVPGSQMPISLENASAELKIVNGQGGALLTINSGATSPASGIYFGGQEQDPTNGIIDITIDASDTEVSWQYAQYEMTITTQTFGQQTLLYGTFAVVGFTP